MNIGVFDSGLGGLWVLKSLQAEMPNYDYVFLADQMNVPYGEKTSDELFEITIKALTFLFKEKNCAGVVLACNTISSTIYERLRDWKDKEFFGKILFGIVHPTVESLDKESPLVVFATPKTCESVVYENFLNSHVSSYLKIPMKELAYLIENGGDTYSYVSTFNDKVPNEITRGALLCTHYGIVKDDFKNIFPNIKEWICQEDIIPKYLKDYFIEFPERESFFSHNGNMNILVTKKSKIFDQFAKDWFGEKVQVELIDLNK